LKKKFLLVLIVVEDNVMCVVI